MNKKIKRPQALKAKLMIWTDVSYHGMEEIDKMQSIPDLESALCSVLGVDLPEPKRGVLLELYVQTVLFCRERSFKKEQTSALLSIIKSIHEANTETPLDNIDQCFKYCKELLLCHSVRRPPFSINLFSSEEVKLDLCLTYSGIPDQDGPAMDDSSAPDVENMMEKEAEAGLKTDSSPQTQEASMTDPEGSILGPKSELRALIEKEVREQMMFVSGQLDQRMKEMADQHNRALESPRLHHKAKK